uniref:Glycosyltransferase 6 domain containing 1 n=2 Tax=Molossus molossus TaxID=27622 RepID=A0A7J8EDD4_MOLMO|nr:glycosyltransferase 6 domain containing 1 [Molossus molossus]
MRTSEQMRSSTGKFLLLALLVLCLLLGLPHLRDPAELRLSDWFNPRNRPDVTTTTDWQAPVIWEGTFDRRVLQRFYGRQNLTVGLAVFATGRVADRYLDMFLKSANEHFMVGYPVIVYVMVDSSFKLPYLPPAPLRTFRVLAIKQDGWWPDLHFLRMKNLGKYVVSHIQEEADFLFSMSVDQIFQTDVGVETLGAAVAQLHAWWYFRDKQDFPYERELRSAAYIPLGEGDFFYDGAMLGGTPSRILDLVEAYTNGVLHDFNQGVHSTYERHLNKYFFLHKPTKLLSPEYNWDAAFYPPPPIQYVKVLQLAKKGL